MNSNKFTLTNILVAILLIANIVTLSLYWLKKEKLPSEGGRQGRADEFVIKELQLDSNQQNAYKALITAHRTAMRNIKEKSREHKEAFFNLLKNTDINGNEFHARLTEASQEQYLIDSITFSHFRQLRALCNDEQKKKFDNIIQQVMRMNAPPQGPPPNHRMHEPHPEDRQGPPPLNERNFEGPPPPIQ